MGNHNFDVLAVPHNTQGQMLSKQHFVVTAGVDHIDRWGFLGGEDCPLLECAGARAHCDYDI